MGTDTEHGTLSCFLARQVFECSGAYQGEVPRILTEDVCAILRQRTVFQRRDALREVRFLSNRFTFQVILLPESSGPEVLALGQFLCCLRSRRDISCELELDTKVTDISLIVLFFPWNCLLGTRTKRSSSTSSSRRSRSTFPSTYRSF